MIQYCNYDIKGTLSTTGTISSSGVVSAPGGNSTQWNTSYDNMITGLAVTGTTTKTLTATQQDGGTLTASWTDGGATGVTSVATGAGLDGGTITTTGTLIVEYDAVSTNVMQSGTDYTTSSIGQGDYMMITHPGNTATYRRVGYTKVGNLPFASSSVVSGVTSVATTNGITGGTITSTGTIQLDSTVVRTTGAQSIGDVKTFTSRSDFSNADGLRTNQVRTYGGQQLVLNAGESSSYATGQTAEIVYINAETGLEINSSPDNWSSGWAGRSNAYINRADATSYLPGVLTVKTGITLTGTGRIQGVDTVSSGTDAANKTYVDNAVAGVPSPGNGTFTVTGSSGLSGSGSMTANQSGNSSATLTNTDKGSSQAIYKNFTASSGGTATANSNNDTLTIAAGTNITTVRSGDTITINATNDGQGVTSVNFKTDGTALNVASNTITGSGTMTGIWQGTSSEYVNGLGDRVAFPNIPQGDITAVNAGSGLSGGGTSGSVTLTNSDKGSSQNIFKNIAVSGQSTVVADSNNDTLTLVAAGGMTITTNASADTITFNPNDDNSNYYTTTASFNTGNGIISFSGAGGQPNYSVDIDGRFLPLAGGTMGGSIDMSNFNVTNVNNISINDPGANEGISWNGGNLWKIYESPNNQTNAAGNLQFVQNTTRRLTIDTSGNLQIVSGDLTVGGGDIILNGTGRIQGVDTVSSGTDAANKNYVDNAISGVPQGTVTSVGITHGGNAFSTGSAVTGSGNLAITMAGNSAQYVRGDGNLATFPSIPQGDITAVIAGTGLTGGGTSGSVTLNVAGGTYTPYNDIRSLGTPSFTNGANPNITTAQVMAEIESDGGFDSYSSVFKTSWSYAGNYNLTDAGDFTETAGSSWITWTDNSSDSVRGNITALAIAPTTGGSAGGVFIYNDQGPTYAPGWRQVWTSTTDGAGSGLDADKLDGQQGSYYLNYANFTGTPSIPSVGNGTLTVQGTGVLGGSGTFTANQSGNSTISVTHDNSGVTAGQYARATVTVNATGHVTAISANGDAQGVTSVATGNGISGGTITSTGTLTVGAGDGLSQSSTGLLVDSTVVRTSGNQTIGGTKTFTSSLPMSNQVFAVASNYGRGVFGLYSSTKFQHVWSMGTAYKVADNGSSPGNIYGLAYTHTNAGGQSKSGLSHQLLVMNSGVTKTAIGTGIWTDGVITANTGQIVLGGTGRIQGVDTVSSSTDAANKAYVDASVPTVNNATITIAAGTNLTTGGNFTTNQSSNETITINMATGGIGAGTYGSTSNATKIDNITVDAYGRVTAITTGGTGDINGVTAGTGLSGGGTSGTPTINVDYAGSDNIIQSATLMSSPPKVADQLFINNTSTTNAERVEIQDIGLSKFNNDAGFTTNTGDITAVNAGTNLSGGGTSGAVTINMSTGGVGSGTYGSTSNGTKIDNITVDAYGRVTGVTTGATGSGNGSVTSIYTQSPIQGGTITSSGSLSLLKPVSGNWHNGGAIVVGTDGLSEIGRYLDFHTSGSSTGDYDVRLQADTNGKLHSSATIRSQGNLEAVGNMVAGYLRTTNGSSSQPSHSFTSDTNTGMYWAGTDKIGFAAGGSQRATIGTSSFYIRDNLGIGTGSPSTKLHVDGVGMVRDSDGVGDFYLGNYATNKHFRFHTNNSHTYFDMNCGNIHWRQGSSNRYYFYPSTANMTINGTLTQNSDIRKKENIVEIDNCIDKVKAMRGVYYNRNDFNTEVTKVGVIAQEVEKVLPELILESPDDGLKSVAYAELTAVLINAIKEQQQTIEDLKTRITKLEK